MKTIGLGLLTLLWLQSLTQQPIVQPGPQEPDLLVLLDRLYGLDMESDLANPARTNPLSAPGLFRKAGPGPVRYTPEIALGLEVTIRGGFYTNTADSGLPKKTELWSYRHKSTSQDIESNTSLAPKLLEGSAVSFDPGDEAFGLFVSNDQFQDTVFTQPAAVRVGNKRLAAQPYKAMIYPYHDPKTRSRVPNSFLICWEYSTNDDFQDVVCRVDNVVLVESTRDD